VLFVTLMSGAAQTTVQFTGIAVERSGSMNINETASAIFAHLAAEHEGLPPIMKLQAGAFTTFQIEPVQIRMALHVRPNVGNYAELFESIESFHLREG
jgi:hypothetical protein